MRRSRLSTPKRILATASSPAALWLLVACLAVGGAASAPPIATASNSHARAQRAAPTPARRKAKSSRQLVSADPRAQYLLIKRTFEGFVTEVVEAEENEYDLNDCSSGSEYLGVPEKDPIVPLADLAYEVVYFKKVLVTAGYPESVWRAPLLEFESQQLGLRLGRKRYVYDLDERRYAAARERIVRAAGKYRARGATHLPKIVDLGECGAAGVAVSIRTVPAGGRVNFIPVFFYELCKAQRLNPDDTAQCDRWREPAEGVLTEVSGDYVYRVSWPDGAQRSGRLSFINLEDGQVVTFRKP